MSLLIGGRQWVRKAAAAWPGGNPLVDAAVALTGGVTPSTVFGPTSARGASAHLPAPVCTTFVPQPLPCSARVLLASNNDSGGARDGAEEQGTSTTSGAAGSTSGGDEHGKGNRQDGEGDTLEAACETWRDAVEGAGSYRRSFPLRGGRFTSLYAWIGKKVALHHVRGVAPEACEEGRFNNLEGDVAEGAQHCLQYLASSSLGAGGGGSKGSTAALGPPHIEEVLGERLQHMLALLKDAGCDWRWELSDIRQASVERIFLIIGAARSGTVRRGPTDILFTFGQQFVLTREQTQQFLDRESGLSGRMSVLQELLFANSILVADVALTATQSSTLRSPPGLGADAGSHGTDDGSSSDCSPREPKPTTSTSGEPHTVKHVLRLEMALSQERSYSSDGVPIMRASPWQIVDWNWICQGNHPSLPRGRPSPW